MQASLAAEPPPVFTVARFWTLLPPQLGAGWHLTEFFHNFVKSEHRYCCGKKYHCATVI
jgi:hypothetical protein